MAFFGGGLVFSRLKCRDFLLEPARVGSSCGWRRGVCLTGAQNQQGQVCKTALSQSAQIVGWNHIVESYAGAAIL